MTGKDSIATAYSFLHQKRNVYVHSPLEWQRDDIECAVASFADSMNPDLLASLAAGRHDFLRDHNRFADDLKHAVDVLETSLWPVTEVKSFDELTAALLYEILKARFTVFVIEQGCHYLDMDDIDYRSLHVFISRGTSVIAYARLFAESEPGVWHAGRVLTLDRGVGLGKRLMERVIAAARDREAVTLRLEAQTHAAGFYERLGFAVCSEVFQEAGIPHVRMELPL